VHGLSEYPETQWPDNIELLYYSFHLMITLGSLFIALMAYASFQNWRGGSRPAPAPLGADAGVSLSLYSQHAGWMNRRAGPSALAHLWPFWHA